MGWGGVRNTAAWEELEVWGWCTGTGVFEEELGVCVLECPLEYELGGAGEDHITAAARAVNSASIGSVWSVGRKGVGFVGTSATAAARLDC